jgi:hypothetical protein
MEWSWLNYVKECFNLGLKFRRWVYMLLTLLISVILTNGAPRRNYYANFTLIQSYWLTDSEIEILLLPHTGQPHCIILINCRLIRSKLFAYKRSGSAEVRHSIFYAFSVGVMNWFVREKDDYMFLYENYYLFLISLTFRWTLNHIFTNSHFKI